MLKLQKPYKPNEYEKLDVSRINELHLAGFIPEYLDGAFVYFRKSNELTEYLNKELPIITSGYIRIEEEEPELEYVITTNVEPDIEFLSIDMQEEEKKYKKSKSKKEVTEDE